MKKVLLFLLIILISNISAIIINEVEMNPIEGENGKEWVELYNNGEENTDLSGWKIYDNIGSRYTIPNGTIIEVNDFYIIEFSSAVLNNKGDFVILYNNNGKEIDRTETLKDSSWSYETLQKCGEKWIFINNTKNKENNCEESEENIQEEEPEETEENISEDEIADDEELTNEEESSIVKISSKEIQEGTEEEVKTIILTPKDIKSEIDKEQLSKNKLAIYGLVVFCILLVFLFIFKKGKKEKNEFR